MTSAPRSAETDTLYEVRHKVYPRAVSGMFARWRWAMVWITQLVFYGLCWLPWNGRQAVLFHLAERKFYLFGWVFWPQDVFYLSVLLIISAFSLFLFTAAAGRLWCGYACPQTVYTEIFLWIERVCEGDRAKRIKLDNAAASLNKLSRKGAKYSFWILLSLWTGISFVGYFTPIRELISELFSLQVAGWSLFWVLFYGGFTYLMAGVMREQVCKYMCPYARFQGVMFDPDTLTITYDSSRGEPRGVRRKGVEPQGQGDCVDCGICVQVCPTGIDIRNGLQYECIGCAACIDACDQVMDKVGLPRGLVRYSTENAIRQHWGANDILRHVLRPRIMIYSAILLVLCVGFLWALLARQPVHLDVHKDRSVMAREVEGELLENVYVLQLINMSEQDHVFSVSVQGVEDAALRESEPIAVPAGESRSLPVSVRVPLESMPRGSYKLYFEILAQDASELHARERSVFVVP
ncbi:MAG: cytochrome c oxidase accessory protein CcoG [Candidatus Dactylopiibacterium carminicum]|nr:MAG: cytochrome c oxidase accessory protein CcoG [Candidatus Dactylopiibacterium carminicum]